MHGRDGDRVATVKRKRGRPRKDAVQPSVAATTTVVKRKRGRPRKKGKPGPPVKYTLNDEQLAYIRENYADTLNSEMMATLGCTRWVLYREAMRMGLTKSEAFKRRHSELALARARELGEATGYMAQQVAMSRYNARLKAEGKRHVHWIPKGSSIKEVLGPERWASLKAKARAKILANIARDRRRIALGLEPLGRMVKAVTLTRQERQIRYRMKKKLGYLVTKDDPVIRYDDKTRRSAVVERHAQEMGIVVLRVGARLVTLQP